MKKNHITLSTAVVVMIAVGAFYVLSGQPLDLPSFLQLGEGKNQAASGAGIGLNAVDPCNPKVARSVSPFAGGPTDCPELNGGSTADDTGKALDNIQTPASYAAPANYQANRQNRIEKMVEGTKKSDVPSAKGVVFQSKYCDNLTIVEKEENRCNEIQAGRSQALAVLQQAASKGDPEASFALAHALVLDSSVDNKQKAIELLEAIPSKSNDMNAFLKYLRGTPRN